jgi:helicase MOV-10
LEVKGVVDRRPSVLVGDYILARRSGDSTDTAWYQGRVHSILFNIVTLYFSDGFSNYRGNKYDIRFVYNRLPERRKHQAVISPYKPMRLLFPDKSHIKNSRATPAEVLAINPVNRELQSNYEQLEAVAAIATQPPGSVPFIIFGP